MILEAIYEGHFETTSHGFRPKRSCHTALLHIQKTFSGTKWFIEGDIKGFFDNIDHDVLVGILRERISDDRFIRLIRKFLKAGYVEDWKFHNTYSGTPQGGIVSPILANIYLDKLDKYVKEYIRHFDKGTKRRPGKESNDLANERKRTVRKLKKVKDGTEKVALVARLKAIEQERAAFPSGDEMDGSYRRLKYIRYADDFILGVIGSKEDARQIKEDIKSFLSESLALELSEEKTLITHTNKSAKFLGYEITVTRDNHQRRDVRGRLRRTYGKRVRLNVSMATLRDKLLEYGAMEIKLRNGKEVWKPKCRSGLIFNDDLEILDRYNRETVGFCNYYLIANNCVVLHNFRYIMEYSMYKTFAGEKYRSTVRKINFTKVYRRNKLFTVKYVVRGQKGVIKSGNLQPEKQDEFATGCASNDTPFGSGGDGEAIVVTQEVEDIISSPVVKEAIINNSDCKILLDQRKFMNRFDAIQTLLGLTDKEKAQILSINQSNDPSRKYKEVWIGLGGVQSAVYATEVSVPEYLAYTTEETEKVEVQRLAGELGGDIELAIRQLAEGKR